MKISIRHLFAVLALCLVAVSFVSCTQDTPSDVSATVSSVIIDYASSVRLDMNSETQKQTVTVKTYIDGDTVHFHVPTSVVETGVFKCRFLAVNTPESTGKIEEYGKRASNFTKEKLSAASSIVIESDSASWETDSTGSRQLAWVWYRNSENEEYRNLNIELLQNGLAIASSAANNRYGETCVAAIASAKSEKLCVHSGDKDPDFFYGDAVELTMRELRLSVEQYAGSKVAFEGVVTVNNNNGVYVEEYDAENDMYNGIYVYYGFGLSGEALEILSVGNRVRIVGSLQYYEAGGTYQVSGLTYRAMRPDDPNNIGKISEGNEPSYRLTDAETFANGKVSVEDENAGTAEYPYAMLAMDTTAEILNLYVKDVYTTTNEDSSSFGAMTLTCESNGVTVTVRTTVLTDDDGNVITSDAYIDSVIDVRGVIDYYDGAYQIRVFDESNIKVIR